MMIEELKYPIGTEIPFALGIAKVVGIYFESRDFGSAMYSEFKKGWNILLEHTNGLVQWIDQITLNKLLENEEKCFSFFDHKLAQQFGSKGDF